MRSRPKRAWTYFRTWSSTIMHSASKFPAHPTQNRLRGRELKYCLKKKRLKGGCGSPQFRGWKIKEGFSVKDCAVSVRDRCPRTHEWDCNDDVLVSLTKGLQGQCWIWLEIDFFCPEFLVKIPQSTEGHVLRTPGCSVRNVSQSFRDGRLCLRENPELWEWWAEKSLLYGDVGTVSTLLVLEPLPRVWDSVLSLGPRKELWTTVRSSLQYLVELFPKMLEVCNIIYVDARQIMWWCIFTSLRRVVHLRCSFVPCCSRADMA